jgi:hypothetical protein
LIKRNGGWKSANVAEGYIESSVEYKLQGATKILGNKEEINVNNNSVSTSKTFSGISFTNCENVSFNNNYNNDKNSTYNFNKLSYNF